MKRDRMLRRFLEYVVKHAVEGDSEEVKAYSLGVDVFGRRTSFDPRLDTIVRVQARRLRSKLQEYYATEGRADQVIIELPKGRYVPEFKPAVPRASRLWPAPVVAVKPRLEAAGALPVARTPLLGRERELAALTGLFVAGRCRAGYGHRRGRKRKDPSGARGGRAACR